MSFVTAALMIAERHAPAARIHFDDEPRWRIHHRGRGGAERFPIVVMHFVAARSLVDRRETIHCFEP
jgi:hypothetical protein